MQSEKNKKKVIISFIIMIFVCASVIACDCREYAVDLPPLDKIQTRQIKGHKTSSETELFFLGKLVDSQEIHFGPDRYRVKYKYLVIDKFNTTIADTVEIITNLDSAGCGFDDKINSMSLITAYLNEGKYYTFRGDCTKSVSEHNDPVRFTRWLKVIETIRGGSNGTYRFNQTAMYYNSSFTGVNTGDTIPALEFTIANGKLEGEWKKFNRQGVIVEHGNFSKGLRNGKWCTRPEFSRNSIGSKDSISCRIVTYKNGIKITNYKCP